MSIKTKIWLICLSAFLTAITFPPYRLGFLIYIAPILLLLVIDKSSPRQAFALSYLWGLVFNLGVLYGVFWATIPGTFGMLAIISLVPALNGLVYKLISQRSRVLALIAWPLLWVSWDFLRTLTQLNFPWGDYGYTQSYYLPLIQSAEIFGVYGVSLMIHIVNVLIYEFAQVSLKKRTRFISLGVALLLPVVFLIYGFIRMPSEIEPGTLKVALAQGDIGREEKWEPGGRDLSFDTYTDMTLRAAADGAKLAIWPETATPFYLLHQLNRLREVKDIVDSLDINILTGTPLYETIGHREYIYFNGAVLLSPQADSIPIYEKNKLVPMSERIPFSGRFKVLKEVRLGQADFSSGRQQTVFAFGSTKFGTAICFESAFPAYCADFHRKGAEFLVVITNDMWFGPSSVPYQHARMSVFRAIENRIPVARCANTGISMFIDKWGRVSDQTDMNERVLKINEISPSGKLSVYDRWGNFIPYSCLIGNFLILIAVAFLIKGKYNGQYEN